MSDYKLVPVQPTDEMTDVGDYARSCGCSSSGIYADMLAAAPDMQGEPDHPRLRQRFDEIEREICEGKHTASSVFTQMRTAVFYAAPQPAEELQLDVSGLVEALVRCRHQASYSIGDNEALSGQLAKVRNIVNETLAAHRKGGES